MHMYDKIEHRLLIHVASLCSMSPVFAAHTGRLMAYMRDTDVPSPLQLHRTQPAPLKFKVLYTIKAASDICR